MMAPFSTVVQVEVYTAQQKSHKTVRSTRQSPSALNPILRLAAVRPRYSASGVLDAGGPGRVKREYGHIILRPDRSAPTGQARTLVLRRGR